LLADRALLRKLILPRIESFNWREGHRARSTYHREFSWKGWKRGMKVERVGRSPGTTVFVSSPPPAEKGSSRRGECCRGERQRGRIL